MSDQEEKPDRSMIMPPVEYPSQRARREVARILEKHGLVTRIPQRPTSSSPQLDVRTKGIGLWPIVMLNRKKFSPYDRLATAAVHAHYAGRNQYPLVVHRRPPEPFTATMYLEHFAELLQLADFAASLETRSTDQEVLDPRIVLEDVATEDE